jgi:hypothetical protein
MNRIEIEVGPAVVRVLGEPAYKGKTAMSPMGYSSSGRY